MFDLSISMHAIFHALINSVEWLILFAVIFIPLAYLFPSKASQGLWRSDMGTDSVFFFISPVYGFIQSSLQVLLVAGLASVLTVGVIAVDNKPYLGTLPLLQQILIILVVTDFLQYWTHRLSHRRMLWKLHAIHHSSKNVDWLSSVRWHPLNFLYHITLTQAVVWSLGFSERAFPLVLIITNVNAALVHANVNWTYGPLRYVFASPVFHRWHHTKPSEGGEKNFAPFFSFYDWMFNTFYMPKGVPANFGTPYDAVPEGFIGQLAYPFKKTDNKMRRARPDGK